ncbi:hypothetical protein [Nonomuraea basaltis]|nr:hypothetical protein [Nonomuraea basaltis]
MAMRVDALRDLKAYDEGDVEMFSGDAERPPGLKAETFCKPS